MATPSFQIQGQNLAKHGNYADSYFFPTIDLNSVPVDVSSGYTLKAFPIIPNSNNNPLVPPFDLSSLATVSFSTTGVSISFAQGALTAQVFQLLSWVFAVLISNDAGATWSPIAVGTWIIDPGSGCYI